MKALSGSPHGGKPSSPNQCTAVPAGSCTQGPEPPWLDEVFHIFTFQALGTWLLGFYLRPWAEVVFRGLSSSPKRERNTMKIHFFSLLWLRTWYFSTPIPFPLPPHYTHTSASIKLQEPFVLGSLNSEEDSHVCTDPCDCLSELLGGNGTGESALSLVLNSCLYHHSKWLKA